ncbi:MAG: SDR family oxidoreductase [Betaproteobacteria bacterium]
MNKTAPAVSDREPRGRKRLGRPRLLIVGCGDVGGRIVALARGRWRVMALTSNPARVPALRTAGVLPLVGNLDDRRSLRRLGAFGARAIHLAPPREAGSTDPRTRHLLAALRARGRLVYISTSGVYGDRGGGWLDETARVMPANDRAFRRLDAERRMRAAGARVLRVPGIYAHDRLPLARLRAGLPALAPEDDVHTNHIHAEDLARIALAALTRGKPTRVYHAVDDSQLKMGEYFDLVADAHNLPRPPRLPREQLRAAVSTMMYSFMAESRRLRNGRIKRELGVKLRWPTVGSALTGQPGPQR